MLSQMAAVRDAVLAQAQQHMLDWDSALEAFAKEYNLAPSLVLAAMVGLHVVALLLFFKVLGAVPTALKAAGFLSKYPAPRKHGKLEQVFENVYVVWGTVRMPGMTITRNMIVFRECGAACTPNGSTNGDMLTIVHPVRLDAETEAELLQLGTPTHIVKLGSHGMDDRYFIDKFGCQMWALPNAEHGAGVYTDVELHAGVTPVPIRSSKLFVFEHTKKTSEACLFVKRGNVDILVSCDAVQNWTDVDADMCSWLGAIVVRKIFLGHCKIGPPWRSINNKKESNHSLELDFRRLLRTHPFSALLSGHGAPLRQDAHSHLTDEVDRVWKRS